MADLRFDVSAETKAATAALGRFAQDVQSKLVNAVRALPNIELTADSTAAQREMKRLRDELAALANKKVGVDIDAGDALAEMQRLQTELRTLGGSTTEVGVRADVAAAAAALGDIEAEARRLDGTEADVNVRADGSTAERQLGDVEARVRSLNGQRAEVEVTADTGQAESEVQGLGSKLSGAAVGAGAAIGSMIGDAAADLIGQAIQTAIETSTANARLEAQLIGDPAAFEQAGAAAGMLFAAGYGDSMDEVNQAVFAAVRSSAEMRDASAADIAAVAESAMNLSQVWGIDVTEALRGAGQLVTNDLVPNTQAGLGLISQAFSELGPAGDDAIDTVVEYSTQFRTLGLDGPAAMNLLTQAIEAGARDTDTAADALKEFAILAVDETSTAADAFRELGFDAEDMADRIAAGGPRAAEGLDMTLDRLRQVEDPVARARLAVELFGTKAEDLKDSLFAMDPTPTVQRFQNLEGTMKDVNKTMGDTVDVHLGAVSRGFVTMATSGGDSADLLTGALGAWTGATALLGDVTGQTSGKVVGSLRTVTSELGDVSAAFAGVPAGMSITVDALTEGATAKLTDLGFKIVETPDGRFEIIPDTGQAIAALDGLVGDAGSRVAIVSIDANPDPATGKLTGLVDLGNGSLATMTLDANPDPATGKISGTVNLGNGQTARITLDANPNPATGQISGVVQYGNGQTATIRAAADPRNAENSLNYTARTRTSYIRVEQIGGIGFKGAGGGLVGYAAGGIVEHLPGWAAGFMRGSGGTPLHLARGGVIAGYQPGVDSVPAMLSRGEAVLVPERVRQIGPGNILDANWAASGRAPTFWSGGGVARFAAGGLVDGAGRVATAVSAGRVAAALAGAGPARAAAGGGVDVRALVAEVVSVRQEIHAMRQDAASDNYGAAQLRELRTLVDLTKRPTGSTALGDADAGLRRSVRGGLRG